MLHGAAALELVPIKSILLAPFPAIYPLWESSVAQH